MKQYILALLPSILLLNGCASNSIPDYSSLSVSQGILNSEQYSALNKIPARYPKKAVKKRVEGCATLEYVITAENQIENVQVVTSTKYYFADAAVKALKNWNWAELPIKGSQQSVKTQTRFEFCLDEPNDLCKDRTLSNACPAEDIVYSTGSIIKRASLKFI